MAARRSAADGMDDAKKAGADPDYLFFLQHLYPDGTSYVLEIPPADGGGSPPIVIKYEELPVAGAGAGINRAGDRKPGPPVVTDPAPTLDPSFPVYMAARRSAADGMDDAKKAGADPDYLFFLQHLYPDGTSYVLEIPPADGGGSPPIVIKYEELPVAGAGAGINRTDDRKPGPPVVTDPAPALDPSFPVYMAARRSAADGMDDAKKAGADPDFLFFLQHLYPDGTSYVLEIPPADGSGSPPIVIKYEELPVAGAGAGINRTGDRKPGPPVVTDPAPPPAREAEAGDDGASTSSVGSNDDAQEVSVHYGSDSVVTTAEKGTDGKE